MRALNTVYSSTHAIKQYGKFMHFHFFSEFWDKQYHLVSHGW